MVTTFRIEGLSELKEALEELKKATATNIQKRALLKAGEPMRDMAQRLAPRAVGTLQSRMYVSAKGHPNVEHEKASKVEIFVGPGFLVQATKQEFGTSHHPPQPFMRPAWDANKLNALNSIKEILAAEIEKARQRAARKAARLLAKT